MADIPQSQHSVSFTDLGELDPTPAINYLNRQGWSATVAAAPEPSAVAAAAQGAVGIVVGYMKVDATLLELLPNLRIIATMSAGFDQIDLQAVSDRGIAVFNLPDAATEEVATHALAMALSLVREIPRAQMSLSTGRWNEDFTVLGRRPSSLTLGIVGIGRIGRKLAQLASPIFEQVIGTDPYLPEEQFPSGVRHLALEQVLANSDVLSLHTSWDPTSPPIISHASLPKLRDRVVIVNTSRGGAIDIDALTLGLTSNRIAGVGLDVFSEEPPRDCSALLNFPNVVLTPHCAYLSEQSRTEYVVNPVRTIVNWAQGKADRAPLVGPSKYV